MAISTIGTNGINQASNTVFCTTSGNVGIGTSSPGAKLHVQGAVGSLAGLFSDATNYTLAIGRSGSTGSVGMLYGTTGSSLALGANNTEAARIDTSGNFLMGLAKGGFAPWSAVSGDAWGARIGATYPISANNSDIVAIFNRTTSTGTIVELKYNATVNGSISTNGTNVSYNTSSDYRLKENVQPMMGALSVVQALKPCTYTWKADGSNGHGFIAHELQAVVPDCVTGEKDAVDDEGNPVYQGIDTSFLVATLTAAIQELNAKVEAQAAEIAALKGTA